MQAITSAAAGELAQLDMHGEVGAAGQPAAVLPKAKRPCKGKRERYDNLKGTLVKRLVDDPTADLSQVVLPSFIALNEPLKQQLFASVEKHRQEILLAQGGAPGLDRSTPTTRSTRSASDTESLSSGAESPPPPLGGEPRYVVPSRSLCVTAAPAAPTTPAPSRPRGPLPIGLQGGRGENVAPCTAALAVGMPTPQARGPIRCQEAQEDLLSPWTTPWPEPKPRVVVTNKLEEVGTLNEPLYVRSSEAPLAMQQAMLRAILRANGAISVGA